MVLWCFRSHDDDAESDDVGTPTGIKCTTVYWCVNWHADSVFEFTFENYVKQRIIMLCFKHWIKQIIFTCIVCLNYILLVFTYGHDYFNQL